MRRLHPPTALSFRRAILDLKGKRNAKFVSAGVAWLENRFWTRRIKACTGARLDGEYTCIGTEIVPELKMRQRAGAERERYLQVRTSFERRGNVADREVFGTCGITSRI